MSEFVDQLAQARRDAAEREAAAAERGFSVSRTPAPIATAKDVLEFLEAETFVVGSGGALVTTLHKRFSDACEFKRVAPRLSEFRALLQEALGQEALEQTPAGLVVAHLELRPLKHI